MLSTFIEEIFMLSKLIHNSLILDVILKFNKANNDIEFFSFGNDQRECLNKASSESPEADMELSFQDESFSKEQVNLTKNPSLKPIPILKKAQNHIIKFDTLAQTLKSNDDDSYVDADMFLVVNHKGIKGSIYQNAFKSLNVKGIFKKSRVKGKKSNRTLLPKDFCNLLYPLNTQGFTLTNTPLNEYFFYRTYEASLRNVKDLPNMLFTSRINSSSHKELLTKEYRLFLKNYANESSLAILHEKLNPFAKVNEIIVSVFKKEASARFANEVKHLPFFMPDIYSAFLAEGLKDKKSKSESNKNNTSNNELMSYINTENLKESEFFKKYYVLLRLLKQKHNHDKVFPHNTEVIFYAAWREFSVRNLYFNIGRELSERETAHHIISKIVDADSSRQTKVSRYQAKYYLSQYSSMFEIILASDRRYSSNVGKIDNKFFSTELVTLICYVIEFLRSNLKDEDLFKEGKKVNKVFFLAVMRMLNSILDYFKEDDNLSFITTTASYEVISVVAYYVYVEYFSKKRSMLAVKYNRLYRYYYWNHARLNDAAISFHEKLALSLTRGKVSAKECKIKSSNTPKVFVL